MIIHLDPASVVMYPKLLMGIHPGICSLERPGKELFYRSIMLTNCGKGRVTQVFHIMMHFFPRHFCPESVVEAHGRWCTIRACLLTTDSPSLCRSLDSLLGKAAPGLSVLDSHLVEIDGGILYLYGSGALESLDRNWSVQTAGSIATVSFIFIDFDEIVPVLPKLKIKFPNSLVSSFRS